MGRTWIKLWVNEWLEGTTRYEMSNAQRALWLDVLALAGRSPFDGIICAGKIGDRFIGYPLERIKTLGPFQELDVLGTLRGFEATGKIAMEITSEEPMLIKIEILNWKKYQSDYSRQKPYRAKAALKKVTSVVTTQSTEELLLEVEGEKIQTTGALINDPSGFLTPSCLPETKSAAGAGKPKRPSKDNTISLKPCTFSPTQKRNRKG